jgi:hypothetical protein
MKTLSLVQRHFRRFLSPALLAGALSLGAVVGTSHVALADEVEVEVEVQPPVARVEVIPPAPSPKHFWIHGYWGWGATHYWVPGRYEVIRPGYGYAEARWVPVGRHWHFYPGRWYVR